MKTLSVLIFLISTAAYTAADSPDTFRVLDYSGRLYTLRLEPTITWEHTAKIPGWQMMAGALALRPSTGELYRFSAGDNHVRIWDPTTGESREVVSEGAAQLWEQAKFASNGSTIYIVGVPAESDSPGLFGMLLDAETLKVLRTYRSFHRVGSESPGRGFSIDKAAFADDTADLLIWNYEHEALLRFSPPYDMAQVVYSHPNPASPAQEIISGDAGTLVYLTEEALPEQQKIELRINNGQAATAVVNRNRARYVVETSPASTVQGIFDFKTNEVRLLTWEGAPLHTFQPPYGPPPGHDPSATPNLVPYRELSPEEAEIIFTPVSVWLSSSNAYTIIAYDGGYGIRGFGYLVIRDNQSGLWSDLIPTGTGTPLVSAQWAE